MKVRPYVLDHHQREGHALAMPKGQPLALMRSALGSAFIPTAPVDAAPLPTPRAGAVAIVPITGPLFQRGFESWFGLIEGYDDIEARFIEALNSPDVGAIVLMIDSPGGQTAGLFETVSRMRAARAKSGKPVFAFANELIASAGYAIACVADQGIYLPASAEVGCIGVLMIHFEASAANEKDGFKYTIISSGARKAEGSDLEPLGDTARLAMQQRTDELAATFFQLVAETRGITPEAVRALEGACFTGAKVVEVGLATAIQSRDQVLAMAAAAAGAVGMTDEEKAEMEALKAENAKLKAAAAEGEEDDEETDGDDAEEDLDEDEEEEAPAAKKVGAKAELARLKAKDEARDLVDAAAREGKVAPSARQGLVDHGVTHGIASLKATLAILPVRKPARKVSGSPPPPSAGGVSAALTPIEKTVCMQMGITEEAFAKSKAMLQKEEA